MKVEEYQTMKKQADKLGREAERAAGKVETLTAQLQEQFGCKTLKEAEKKLRELEKRKDELEQDFERRMTVFKEEWGERLEEVRE